ncbi:MAG: type II secretion system GspH family protein [Fimbriimonadales bacterium]|nr:type II secretion system GspH family protein [Fimbriimonadales bacterium]
MRRRGWTLVEILVVVAILLTLFGIIWAAYQPARERSLRTVCASKMRQIWVALENYRQDYGGIDPPAALRASVMGLPATWEQEMRFKANYLRRFPDGWMCPTGRPMEGFTVTIDFCNGFPCWQGNEILVCQYPHCAFYELWIYRDDFEELARENAAAMAAWRCQEVVLRHLGMQYPILWDTCHRQRLDSPVNNFTLLIRLDGSFWSGVMPISSTYRTNLCEEFGGGS